MRFGHSKNKETEINLTPLIDVVFLLLVFFMVSTKFVSDNSFDVNLPLAKESDATPQQNRLMVSVSAEGFFAVNGEIIAEKNKKTLAKVLSNARNASPEDLIVSINADGGANYQLIIDIIDVARLSGIRKVELATKKTVRH